MPDHKRSGDGRPQLANLRKEPLPDLEDVTVLFSPPPELLERTARQREDRPKPAPAPPQDWDSSEDEATLAIPLSDALASLEPLYDKPPPAKPAPAPAPIPKAFAHTAPTSAPVPKLPAQPALKPLTPAPPISAPPISARPTTPAPPLELSDAELGAILGPRRKARWLAFGGVLAVVLIVIAVARLAP